MNIDKNTFDPALLSFPDCDYLLAHAGEPPVIALQELPATVNRVTMAQWIERFYELEELKKARGYEWAGVEAVKTAIRVYLAQRAKWAREVAYGAPKTPSMFAFDARGNAHESAPGSDSGRVRTYFDASGKRIPFAINLIDAGSRGAWKPDWIAAKAIAKSADQPTAVPVEVPTLIEPEGKNCIECGVPGCGYTAVFRPESRSSHNAARARLSKHLRTSKTDTDLHLELHTLEFGSSRSVSGS